MKGEVTQVLTQTLKDFNKSSQKDIKNVYELLQEYVKLLQFLGKILNIIGTKQLDWNEIIKKVCIDAKLLEKYFTNEEINLVEQIRKIIEVIFTTIKETHNPIPPFLQLIRHYNETINIIDKFINSRYNTISNKLYDKKEYSQLVEHFDKIIIEIEKVHKKEYTKIFNEFDLNSLKSSIGNSAESYGHEEQSCTNRQDNKQLSTIEEVYSDLVDIFDSNADFYIELGKFNLTADTSALNLEALKYYTYSAIFCQNALKLIETHSLPKTKKKKIQQKYEEIQKLVSASINKDIKSYLDKSSEDKKLFNDLREKLKNLGHNINNTEVRKFYEHTTKEIKNYLTKLHKEAAELLGDPPCKYTVIGLGSMAHGTITPYSDLEFAILTENDNIATLEYFRKLSYLVQLRVIGLGETIISCNHYGIKIDYFINPGIMLDFGKKTPLGDPDKGYELIGTVKHFMKYVKYQNEPIDKNLFPIFQNICLVHGETSLFNEYKQELSIYLSTFEAKARCLEIFFKGRSEMKDGTSKTTMSDKDHFTLDEFDYSPFNIKNMYRLLTVCIQCLNSILYENSTKYEEDTANYNNLIDSLHSRGKINNEAATNLKEALDFIIWLKSIAYAHYGMQKEPIIIEDVEDIIFKDDKGNVITKCSRKKLDRYYIISLTLKKKLQEFNKEFNKKWQKKLNEGFKGDKEKFKEEFLKETNFFDNNASFFDNMNFHDDHAIYITMIDMKLLEVSEGMEFLLTELSVLKNKMEKLQDEKLQKKYLLYATNIIDIIKSISEYGYKYVDQKPEILAHFKEGVNILKNYVKDFCIAIWHIIDIAYWNWGVYTELLKFYEKALGVYISLSPDFDYIVTNSNYNETKCPAIKTLIFYGITLEIYIGEDYSDINSTINIFNKIYISLKKNNFFPDQLKNFHKTYLKTMEAVYTKLENNYPNIAYSILQNLGAVYCKLGDLCSKLKFSAEAIDNYIAATNKYKEALDILVITNPLHVDVPQKGAVCDKLGDLYNKLRQYEKAIKYYNLSLIFYDTWHDDDIAKV